MSSEPADAAPSKPSATAGVRRRIIEVVCALLLLALLLSPASRATARVWATAASFTLSSLFDLLRVDTAATLWALLVSMARLGLAVAPGVLVLRRASRLRRIVLSPLLALVTLGSTPLSLAACASADRWVLLIVLAAVGYWLGRLRYLGGLVLLPFVVLWEIVPSHGLLMFGDVGTRDPAYREKLLRDCARHDGERPRNLIADRIMPYHGINMITEDLAFLSGEGPNDGGMRGNAGGRRVGSWWLRRRDGQFEFEAPSEATGNLWRGCKMGETLWTVRANYIVGAQRMEADPPNHERVTLRKMPSSDIDCGEPACDEAGQRIYVTESLNGGMWELSFADKAPRRHELGGVLLLPLRRFDGKIVISNSASLMVFDPQREEVVERVSTGLADDGFDLCAATGAAAVADLTGRVRLFDLDEAGRYRFRWGVSVFAPRRVAFSRDCSRLAVTSSDDHSVFIIDVAGRRVIDTFHVGPALREVMATGPREFSVTDVCSVTSFRW